MKIEPKDIKEYLSLKSRWIVTGKSWTVLAKNFLEKHKKGFKSVLGKIKTNITNTINNIKDNIISEEDIRIITEEELKEIEAKRSELKNIIHIMEQDDEYRIGENRCYLIEIKKTLRKFNKKKVKVSKKGLGIFSLTKSALLKIKNNIENKWENYLLKKEENINRVEIEKAKEQLKINFDKLMRLKQEEKEILEAHPEINSEDITHTITKTNDVI